LALSFPTGAPNVQQEGRFPAAAGCKAVDCASAWQVLYLLLRHFASAIAALLTRWRIEFPQKQRRIKYNKFKFTVFCQGGVCGRHSPNGKIRTCLPAASDAERRRQFRARHPAPAEMWRKAGHR